MDIQSQFLVTGLPVTTVTEVMWDVQGTSYTAGRRVVTDTRGRRCHKGNFQGFLAFLSICSNVLW